MQALAQRYPKLTHLRLCGCGYVTDHALVSLSLSVGDLVSIAVSSCPLVTDQGVIDAVSLSSHRLEELEIADSQIGDTAVIHVFESCAKLRILDVSNCLAVTDLSLKALARTAAGRNCQFSAVHCL